MAVVQPSLGATLSCSDKLQLPQTEIYFARFCTKIYTRGGFKATKEVGRRSIAGVRAGILYGNFYPTGGALKDEPSIRRYEKIRQASDDPECTGIVKTVVGRSSSGSVIEKWPAITRLTDGDGLEIRLRECAGISTVEILFLSVGRRRPPLAIIVPVSRDGPLLQGNS